MELPLLVSKIALQRMRSPNAEILDILSARPVEHHIEAMERLNIGNEFYPLLTGDGVLSENLPDLLKYRIVCDYIFPSQLERCGRTERYTDSDATSS